MNNFLERILPAVRRVLGAVIIILAAVFGFEASGFEAEIQTLLDSLAMALGTLVVLYDDAKDAYKSFIERFDEDYEPEPQQPE